MFVHTMKNAPTSHTMLNNQAPNANCINDTIYYKFNHEHTHKAIVQCMCSHVIQHVLIYEISKCVLLGKT